MLIKFQKCPANYLMLPEFIKIEKLKNDAIAPVIKITDAIKLTKIRVSFFFFLFFSNFVH